MVLADVFWGPVAAWAAAGATFTVAIVAVLAGMGTFDVFRGPRLRITFEDKEPWCRTTKPSSEATAYWVRLGVENVGRRPASRCVGRMIGLATEGTPRTDVDPIQLRWAGVPRSRAFDPIDIRRGQREFLDVLMMPARSHWQVVTYEHSDFDPGFPTAISTDEEHVLWISVFADNAATVNRRLSVFAASGKDIALRIV